MSEEPAAEPATDGPPSLEQRLARVEAIIDELLARLDAGELPGRD